MGLKDLIREAHSTEDLGTVISQFLRVRASTEVREPGWHPSQFAGMCTRFAVLEKLLGSAKKTDKFDAGSQRIFDVGHALHAWYQNEYLGKMGILWGKWECRFCGAFHWGFKPDACFSCKSGKHSFFTYKEVPMRGFLDGCESPVVGHADGIVKFDGKWYVLEIKTMNSYGHGALDEPYANHNSQAQVYVELIRQGFVSGVTESVRVPFPNGIIFLYISKNDSREKIFEVPANEKLAQAELAKPVLVEKALRERFLPDRKPECISLLKDPAKKCAYCSHCFGQKGFEQLSLLK